jgi:hypothetical protein
MRSVAWREVEHMMCRHHVTIRKKAEAKLMASEKHSHDQFPKQHAYYHGMKDHKRPSDREEHEP